MPQVPKRSRALQDLNAGPLAATDARGSTAVAQAEQALGMAYAKSLKEASSIADKVLQVRAETIANEEETSPDGYVAQTLTKELDFQKGNLDDYTKSVDREVSKQSSRLSKRLGYNPYGKQVMERFNRWGAKTRAQAKTWYNTKVLELARNQDRLDEDRSVKESKFSANAQTTEMNIRLRMQKVDAQVGVTIDPQNALFIKRRNYYNQTFAGGQSAAFRAGVSGKNYDKEKRQWNKLRGGLFDEEEKQAFDDMFESSYARGFQQSEKAKAKNDPRQRAIMALRGVGRRRDQIRQLVEAGKLTKEQGQVLFSRAMQQAKNANLKHFNLFNAGTLDKLMGVETSANIPQVLATQLARAAENNELDNERANALIQTYSVGTDPETFKKMVLEVERSFNLTNLTKSLVEKKDTIPPPSVYEGNFLKRESDRFDATVRYEKNADIKSQMESKAETLANIFAEDLPSVANQKAKLLVLRFSNPKMYEFDDLASEPEASALFEQFATQQARAIAIRQNPRLALTSESEALSEMEVQIKKEIKSSLFGYSSADLPLIKDRQSIIAQYTMFLNESLKDPKNQAGVRATRRLMVKAKILQEIDDIYTNKPGVKKALEDYGVL